MKKHYLIFTLVIVAGIIAGFTFGSIVNNRHSKQAVAASNHPVVKIKKKVADSAPASAPVVAAPDTKKVSAELPPVVVNNVGDKLDMTAADVSEVEQMLNTVGVPADKIYSQRIVNFQKSNNITPTGILDQQTLETLINQATLKFADQRIGMSKDGDS